jgi:hypothetical protein
MDVPLFVLFLDSGSCDCFLPGITCISGVSTNGVKQMEEKIVSKPYGMGENQCLFVKGAFLGFFLFMSLRCLTLLHLRPPDSIVSEDAGIEPRTVATVALPARRFNHSTRSYPQTRL